MATETENHPPAVVEPAALKHRPGKAAPLGANVDRDGVNFAVYSQSATQAWLALFNSADEARPVYEVALDPERYRFGDIWSVYVEGLQPGCIYAWRFDGPKAAKQGHRYDPSKYLLDPYAQAVVNSTRACRPRPLVFEPESTAATRSPRTPLTDTIIYEMHVRGFTAHESSGVSKPGTYAGAVEKIPYLKELGITAVELLPVHECGEGELGRTNPETGEELTNYWGYSTIGFFAPSGRYASSGPLGGQVAEFRAMVDAFHDAGIEVYLDVVYNHTSEGNHKGPLLSFRGIDNRTYYILEPDGKYANYSGCGNTFNCNNAVASDLIIDSLRHWATEMGVDGFRFDLATVLNRDPTGRLLENAPLVQRMSEDPVLKGVKLIAEAWDVGGGYQVGRFGSKQWADWNDRFRDDVRRFWRGDPGTKSDFALRITGSPDIYQSNGRTPLNSVNFVTAHDGFTLHDLVSYNDKHNLANGEDNRDGSQHNLSWNCGVEGETDEPEVGELRTRMQKSMFATLFLSLGVPMMLGGDEFSRTQRGNNNAYCQDNEISWFDWSRLESDGELFRFCRYMIAFRKANPVFKRDTFFDGKPRDDQGNPDIAWFDAMQTEQRWTSPDHVLACGIHPECNGGQSLYMMFNPTLVAREFKVPDGEWEVCINTARPAPNDSSEVNSGPRVTNERSFVLGRKGLAVLRRIS